MRVVQWQSPFAHTYTLSLRDAETLNSKPVKLRLKIDLVSYPARAEGLGK